MKRLIINSSLVNKDSLLPHLAISIDIKLPDLQEDRVLKHPSVDCSLTGDAWFPHCPLHLCFLVVDFDILRYFFLLDESQLWLESILTLFYRFLPGKVLCKLLCVGCCCSVFCWRIEPCPMVLSLVESIFLCFFSLDHPFFHLY